GVGGGGVGAGGGGGGGGGVWGEGGGVAASQLLGAARYGAGKAVEPCLVRRRGFVLDERTQFSDHVVATATKVFQEVVHRASVTRRRGHQGRLPGKRTVGAVGIGPFPTLGRPPPLTPRPPRPAAPPWPGPPSRPPGGCAAR